MSVHIIVGWPQHVTVLGRRYIKSDKSRLSGACEDLLVTFAAWTVVAPGPIVDWRVAPGVTWSYDFNDCRFSVVFYARGLMDSVGPALHVTLP